jgi:hypothetical protein
MFSRPLSRKIAFNISQLSKSYLVKDSLGVIASDEVLVPSSQKSVQNFGIEPNEPALLTELVAYIIFGYFTLKHVVHKLNIWTLKFLRGIGVRSNPSATSPKAPRFGLSSPSETSCNNRHDNIYQPSRRPTFRFQVLQ